ncbi:MAG: trypsin-like peptidase domain-containing protein [Phycisphaerae bacterium]|nr:trypsin-like peptidase domain-containing protein [Phycisphaerae bacterium]
MNSIPRAASVAVLSLILLSVAAVAAPQAAVTASPIRELARIEVPSLDVEALRAEDLDRAAEGLAPRFAVPTEVFITPDTDGTWETLADGTRVWRLRINSPGALSLNLGFTGYYMPPGGELRISSADAREALRPFTAEDNEDHGELWTPVVLSDDVIVEVRLPATVSNELVLQLTAINVGYRFFGEPQDVRSGSCNIDVICPEGDGWRDEIQAVGVISTGGSTFCTGFMVNNTAHDRTPYFMTANHCGINSGNASSLVVYWNFQSPTCGQHGGGSLSQYQTGSYFRATYSTSDFTLVELDDEPNPDHNVAFAGWSRSTADPTSAVAIHHPSTDEKSISFEYDPCTTTSYLGTTIPGNGSHIRVTDWDLGTTEPGSSGSPLFDQNHHVVGQLHGGYAACGNDDSDWYGRFSMSWDGGGSDSSRLSTWLDPLGTGAISVDTLSGKIGLEVTPETDFYSEGHAGGPFEPLGTGYTLENVGDEPFDYEVTADQDWVSITNATGTLLAGQTVDVSIGIGAVAAALENGQYNATVSFANLTDSIGDTTRAVALKIGIPRRQIFWLLNSDPSWSVEGEWEFGVPAGLGGTYGYADPDSGATGDYVYGVNLNGDYSTGIGGPYYMTMGPFDVSDLTEVSLKYQRWLNSDYSPYAVSMIEASINGSDWVGIWTNGNKVVKDSDWVLHEVDMASLADNQPQVWLRWGYRIGNGAFAYSGWNVDDIEIWGLAPGDPDPLGDMNCDGSVDVFDIDAFVMAIIDADAFAAAYPMCDINSGDCNGDSTVDIFDIDAFVGLITGN